MENETWNKGRKVGTDASTGTRVARANGIAELLRSWASIVLSSRYPNGAVAVVTIGVIWGVNMCNRRNTMVFPSSIEKENRTVYDKDLVETSVEITSKIVIKGNCLTIPDVPET